jgi:hypothetical protein
MRKEIACMPTRKLLACFAILSICGCSPNADKSENRLSDSELLKLNVQCREAADRVENEKFVLEKGEIYVQWILHSAKYSQKHRRCIAHFSTLSAMKNVNNANSDEFIDPVSGSVFAQRKTIEGIFSDNYWIASWGLDGPLKSADSREYRKFTTDLMASP